MARSATDQRLIDTAAQIELWARDPWQWIADCVWTQDEADGGAIKRLPLHPYLQLVVERWMTSTLLAIPKSRRMMLTWCMLACHLWQALFFPRSAVFIQSKKEDDSDFLMGDKRMLFIYNQLPKAIPWPTVVHKHCSLEFSNGSYVRGVAQGADQLRQFTATCVLCDEMAFWEQAMSTWTALKPIIQGGGKVAMISSAGPGFFQRIVEGRIKDEGIR